MIYLPLCFSPSHTNTHKEMASFSVVLNVMFLVSLIMACEARQLIEKQKLGEQNGNKENVVEFSGIKGNGDLGEMKDLLPFPNIPFAPPFPQIPFPPTIPQLPFPFPLPPPIPELPLPLPEIPQIPLPEIPTITLPPVFPFPFLIPPPNK